MIPDKRNGPGANRAESETKTTNTKDSTAARSYPARITLRAEAEQYLSLLAIDLQRGDVQLYQLPDSLLAIFTVGWDRGCVAGYDNREQVLRPRIRRLEFERDQYYWCYSNGKTLAEYRRAQTAELWRQGSEVAA